MQNVLISGAAGFIGSHLCEYFLKKNNCKVYGFDNFTSSDERNIQYLKKQNSDHFYFKKINVLDKESLNHFIGETKIHKIFHLACPASPPIYQKDPLNTLDVCYLGTKNMLEIAKNQDCRIFLASTSEIYGDPEIHPQPESYRGNVNTVGIRSCYDEGKRVLETLGFIYAQNNVQVRVGRIFNTYGPRMNPSDGRVIINFVHQALQGEPLTIYGDGSQTRSLCFYSDLIDGIIKLFESKCDTPVNLGSEFEFSVYDLAVLIKNKINPNLNLVYLPLPSDDPKMRRPNLSKAKKLLNWEPKVTLSEGLDAVIQFYQNKEQ